MESNYYLISETLFKNQRVSISPTFLKVNNSKASVQSTINLVNGFRGICHSICSVNTLKDFQKI